MNDKLLFLPRRCLKPLKAPIRPIQTWTMSQPHRMIVKTCEKKIFFHSLDNAEKLCQSQSVGATGFGQIAAETWTALGVYP